MTLNELAKMFHEQEKKSGFVVDQDPNDPNLILSKLMLVVTELAEAAEDVRNGHTLVTIESGGKPVGFPTELADALIRILGLSAFLGIDMDSVVSWKHEYNKTRPHKHGGKLC